MPIMPEYFLAVEHGAAALIFKPALAWTYCSSSTVRRLAFRSVRSGSWRVVDNAARYCESIDAVRSEKKPVMVEVFDLTPPLKLW
jgi:hypothetical protein